ncbi:MAG TPA: hypothetical protein VFV58_05780, partial [Blastocatellia bacterium]|jgi:hypothetical protein|nr:hypothetical protein [Blastocatellia bacterium]
LVFEDRSMARLERAGILGRDSIEGGDFEIREATSQSADLCQQLVSGFFFVRHQRRDLRVGDPNVHARVYASRVVRQGRSAELSLARKASSGRSLLPVRPPVQQAPLHGWHPPQYGPPCLLISSPEDDVTANAELADMVDCRGHAAQGEGTRASPVAIATSWASDVPHPLMCRRANGAAVTPPPAIASHGDA